MSWAARLDRFVSLPAYGSPLTSGIFLLIGAALIIGAAPELWVQHASSHASLTPALPRVQSGSYRIMRYPVHVGAVMVGIGLALGFRSPAGLWIISPLMAAAAVAWVLGYETIGQRHRLDDSSNRPLAHLPADSSTAPSASDKASVHVLLFLPWLMLYAGVEFLGVPPDAVIGWQSWEYAIPVLPWTEPLYLLAYPFLLAVPFVAATRADLRRFILRGWMAIILIIPLYLLVPVIAPAKPVAGEGVLQTLMRLERAYDNPVTAFPAFHVVWMLLAAQVYARRWERLAPLWWLIAVAVSVSCVTVGMHASIDVLGGVVAFLAIVRLERIRERFRTLEVRAAGESPERLPAYIPPKRIRGRALHSVQMYSAAWILFVAAVLLRLWIVGASLQLIVGLFFVLAGLGGFVEKRYTGELGRRAWRGLRFQQWLAIAAVLVGAVMTTAGWTPAPPCCE